MTTFNRFPIVNAIPSYDPVAAFYRLMEPLGPGEEYGVVGAVDDEEEEEEECPCMGGLSYCWRCDAPECGCWEPDCTVCYPPSREEHDEDEEIQLFTKEEIAELVTQRLRAAGFKDLPVFVPGCTCWDSDCTGCERPGWE